VRPALRDSYEDLFHQVALPRLIAEKGFTVVAIEELSETYPFAV
jgi:hypothetical protein